MSEHTMIRAYRAFRLADGMLRPCAIATAASFEGPIVRGDPPCSKQLIEDVLADPVAAVREQGEKRVLSVFRAERTHGFHAWADREDAVHYAKHGSERQRWNTIGPTTIYFTVQLWGGDDDATSWYYPVFGEVELFGRVVEHEIGYRAQSFRICKLWVLDPKIDREALENRYHCEVELWPTSEGKSESTKSSPENSMRLSLSSPARIERPSPDASGKQSRFQRSTASAAMAVFNAAAVMSFADQGDWLWILHLVLVAFFLVAVAFDSRRKP